MIWWYFWVPLIGVGLIVAGIFLLEKWDLGFGFALVIVALLAFLACGLVNLIVWPMRANGRNVCHQFAKNTGYETKFVLQGFTSTGECFVKAADGRWVSKDSIIINVPAKESR